MTTTPEPAPCGARYRDAVGATLTCHLPLGHHTLHRAHTTPGERHTWADAPTETSPEVRGYCPACGGESLFLGAGGYITCARLDCSQPDAASTLLETDPRTAPEAPATAEQVVTAADPCPGCETCDLATQLAQERAAHEEHRQQLATALSEARGHGWDHLIGRAESVCAAATERADLLEEARDALESAGQGGAHGDDWPAIAPAIRKLAAELDLARTTANDYAAADSADAAAGSYAHRAEHAEAERDRLAAELRDARYETDAETKRADRAEGELAEAREKYRAGLRKADEELRAMNAELARYADGTEGPVLWSVYNKMHSRAATAEATLARARKALAEAKACGGEDAGCTVDHRDIITDILDGEQSNAAPGPAAISLPLIAPCAQCGDATARCDANGRFLCQRCDSVKRVGVRLPIPTEHYADERPPEPEPVPREVCCGCGRPDIAYRNYRDLPFCHRCAASTTVEYGGHGYHPPTAAPEPDDAELTAEEARDLADDLALQLYRADDALAFVAEMCDIADREGTPVTTTRVRDWLKGAQCARQVGLVITGGPVADAVRRHHATEKETTMPRPYCCSPSHGHDYDCTDPTPDTPPRTPGTATVSFADAVETATEEEVSGPDPDEPETVPVLDALVMETFVVFNRLLRNLNRKP